MKIKNFNLLKRFFAFVLALVMIFNLSSDIFAQLAINNNNNFYFPQTKQYQQEVDKLSLELEAQKRQQEILALQGITFENFQKELKDYAKKNNIDYSTIDEKASWENYLAIIDKYNKDYQTLVGIFAKKTYQQVLSDGKYFLNKKDETIKYDGKNYNRTALIHATIHNFVTRQKNGYTGKGMFVFSKETAEPFSLEEKISVMEYIYNAVENEGIYQQDSNNLYAFAYNIVENGKKYMDNDIYKADIMPGLANADDRQKRTNGQADRKKQADAVGAAIALLPLLSKTNTQKTQSAQVIYDLAKKVMRDDYGVIGISNGAQALVALKTDDSLNKLYALLTEDLYRGLGTRVAMFALDSLSLEEWAKRDAGLVNRAKGGLGQYHNAIARRYLYIDPKKNNAETMRLAQNSALEGFYNVVYTDMFEDIGKAIGKYSSDEKVAKIANRLASKYLQDTANKIRGGEKKLHTSLITGILATTKQKNETLTKAAKIIYNGSWWDINEATQRDKNNIAANYLNLEKKKYNEQKKKDFKTICAAKNVGRFSDIAVNALFMGTLILSLPSIAKKVSTFSIFKIRNIKLKVKSADVKVAKEVSSKPAQPKPVEMKLPEVKPSTEKVDVKIEENTPKQTEYTASVGEGGGGAAAGKAELSYTELSKMTRQQWLNEMTTKLRRAREAQEIEAEIAANKGKISPYNKTWLVNKPWAELSPWRKTLATALINLEFNREIFLSSLRIFKPKYIGFSAPLPLALSGEALLKPVASVTQMTRTAESGFISTQAVFGAAQNAQRAAALAKASGSTAGVLNTNKAFSMLDIFQQYSAGKGLLSGNFGINGILNEFHGGSSSGNSGLSTLEKENLIRANRTPQINSAVTTNNPYTDFMATQQNLNAQAKDIVKEAYKMHLKGDIKGAITEYDNAIKLSPMAVFYFGRGLLKYYNLNDYENAITDFKKAIELNPEDETYKILLEEAQEKLTEKQNKGKKKAKVSKVKKDKDVDWFIKYLETLVDDYASENLFAPVSAKAEQVSFKKMLSGLREKLFASGNKKAKVYISILPITMSVIMKAAEVSVDLVNKVPAIKAAYNKAEERTLKLMERYNFSSQDAMDVFSDIFEKELTKANIPLERVQELLQEANDYMRGEHSVRLAQEISKEDPQAQFDEVNQNTTADYDQTLAVLADDLRIYYDSQSNTWKYGYQQEPEDTFATINLIQEHYIQGKIYYEKGQYQEAIAELDQVIAENPYKTALEMRGQSKYNLGDYKGALEDFNEVIAFGYNLPQDYFERGYTKERLGDYDGAIADYQKALKYNDANSDMYQIYESIYNNAIEKAQAAKENPVETQTPETEAQKENGNTSSATEEEKPVSIKEESLKDKINLPRMILDVFKESFYSRKALLSYYIFSNTKEALKSLSLAIKYAPEEELTQYKEIFKDWSGGQTYEDYIKDNPLFNKDKTKTNSNVKDVLSDLKNSIFGPESSDGKLYMALPFVPKVVMQLLTNDITLEQLSNRQEVIETAFYKAQKRVLQEIVNTDRQEALNQFAYYFKMELEFAGVEAKKIERLLTKTQEYIQNNVTSKEDSQRLNQVMGGLRNSIFGPESSDGKLYMALPFVPKAVMQLLTNDITLEQLSNRQEVIETAFYKAQKRVPQEIVNTDEKEALNQFAYYFKMELEFAGVAQEKTDKLVNKVKEYIGEDTAPQNDKSNEKEVKEQKQKRLSFWAKLKDNKKAENYYKEAISAKEKGDKKSALTYYNQALEYAPYNPQYLYERGMLKMDLSGDYKGAFEDFTKALLADNTNETYFYMRALSGYAFMEDKSIPIKDLAFSIKYTNPKTSIYIVRNNLFTTWTKGQTYEDYIKDNPLVDEQNTQTAQKKTFNQIMSGLRKNLFGSKKSPKLYATILPITTSVIVKIIDGISDIANKRSSVQKAFRRAQNKTEKENLIVYDKETIGNIFLANFKAELAKEQVKKKHIENILTQTKTYFEKEIAKEKEIKQAVFDKYDREQAQSDKKEREIEVAKKAQEAKQTAQQKEVKQPKIVISTSISEQKPIVTEVKAEVQNTPKVQEEKSSQTITTKEVSFWDKIKAKRYFNKSYAYNQNYEQKLAMIDKAIALNPNKAEYYARRATFKVILGKTLSAIADYDRAIEVAPKNADYYYQRAIIEEAEGQKNAALADYSQAIKLAPTNDGYYFSRALLNYYFLEKKNDAIRDLSLSIKYTDKSWQGWKIDEFKKWSGKTYEEYLKDNPLLDEQNTQTAQKKTFNQIMSGLREKIFGPKSSGGKLFMAFIPVIPDEVMQLLTGNLTFEQLNNRTNAIQRAFDNAEEATFKNLKDINSPIAVLYFLSVFSKELENAEVSNKKIGKVFEITKNYLVNQLPEEVRKEESYRLLKLAMSAEEELNDYEKILKIYDLAIEWDNTNADAYDRRAYIKFLMNDDTAKDDYEKAIALDPENEEYKYGYELYLKFYKEKFGIKETIQALFRNFIGRLPGILADLKNQAENKRPFLKSSNQEKAQEFAKRAYEKRLQGYKATSLAYYDEAIILDPSKAEYYYERALAKDQDLGDYDGAMEDYISAMELDSQNADFYTENASKAISTKILRQEEAQKYEDMFDFNIKEGNFDEALANLNQAIELDGYNPEYYYHRGNLQYNKDNLPDALADINKALSLNSNVAKYYMARGSINLISGNYIEAFKDVNRAVELDENNSAYYISRASLKIILKSYNSALSDYNKAIKLDRENDYYYILRADFKYHFGDYEGSLRDYNTAIKLNPDNPEYYIMRAPLREGFGDIDGCLKDYDKAIELNPEEDSYYNIRAIVKQGLEMYEEAIEDFGIAIALNPENPDYYYTRALAISDRDGEDASLDDYNTALDLAPFNAYYYHGRGLALQDKGEYDAALEDFNNAIALDESEPEFYFTRALLNTEYEYYEDALPDMNEAIAIDPYNAEYYYERGLVKEKLNDKRGSLEDFRSAYRLEPKNEKYKKALIKRLH